MISLVVCILKSIKILKMHTTVEELLALFVVGHSSPLLVYVEFPDTMDTIATLRFTLSM